MIVSTLSLGLFLLFVTANGDGGVKSESDLRRALFEHYDKLVRPVTSVNHKIDVIASIVPGGIKDVDVEEKIIKLDTWLFLRWRDEHLMWDPSEYGDLQALRIPATEVWKPDITIYHSTPDTYAVPNVHTNVVLHYNGTALWVPPFTIKSHCSSPQVTEETFHCTIKAGSWTYDVNLLDIHALHQDVLEYANLESAFHDTHKEWTMESMTATREQKVYSCCVEPYANINYNIHLKKRHAEEHDH